MTTSAPGVALPQIDWDLAVATGRRLTPKGPKVSSAEAAQIMANLRACSERSQPLVRQTALIDAPEDTAPLIIVDRPRWIAANGESFRAILAPLSEPGSTGLSGRVAAAEVGAGLAWLATKVLGQFDPFSDPGASDPTSVTHPGRLLLVAPNIVAAERAMGVDPQDFRLWVCLHEETHRVQFTAFPWLGGYLLAQVAEMLEAVDPEGLNARPVLDRFREKGREITLLDLIGDSPEVQSAIDKVTAVMSVLEGHADVIMDRVGPAVIPSVWHIRRRFNQRRESGGLDRQFRRVLGLDVKLAQYRDGARFCRAVSAAVGLEGFNQVFTGPDSLPSLHELHQPGEWLARMGWNQ